ncbi:hypothetical protein, partial [Pectobacterium brasiliense]|uniref:hypothetical protein n=1 Tax=Pectobacterium brasiliense TaxID=180957 RepID=UPI0019698207
RRQSQKVAHSLQGRWYGAGQTVRRPWRTACLMWLRHSGGKCRPASTHRHHSLQASLLAVRHST